jgi:acyl-CoA synthetase (AMP-forming)/AMP-acid ligase II
MLEHGQALTLEDIREHFHNLTARKQGTPELLEIVDELPRTASGKVQIKTLKERARRQWSK